MSGCCGFAGSDGFNASFNQHSGRCIGYLWSLCFSVCRLELEFACLSVGRNDRVGVLGGTSLCLECMYVCVDGYLLLGVGLSLEQYEDV
jgi:hypothetical protein